MLFEGFPRVLLLFMALQDVVRCLEVSKLHQRAHCLSYRAEGL